MLDFATRHEQTAFAIASESVVVVGTGPSGMRAAQEILRRSPDCPMTIFGEERWPPYNRVLLTPLFAGEARMNTVCATWAPGPEHKNVALLRRRIISVDRIAHTVTDEAGKTWPYGKLVLATGSRPHIPAIPNTDHRDVFTFRNLDDVERLLAHWARCRAALVIGGGLLGLEAARGLHRRGIRTCVVEHERWLMFRQVDEAGGATLRDQIIRSGVDVLTGVGVREILADDRVRGARLTDGRTVYCDTIVICAGIRPNVEIAMAAGVVVGHGIRVDDNMQTSDPDIYAVGECAEHRDRIYGLVAPGLEQAGVAAHHLVGGKANYRGSIAATKLKVVGVPVFSMGTTAEASHEPWYSTAVYEDVASGVYRRIFRSRGRLIGAVAVGAWDEVNRTQEALARRRWIAPWQVRRFRRSGQLWRSVDAGSAVAWPAATTVCNCTGVTRGALGDAIAAGATTVDALRASTGASTVCGSCAPLLSELVGSSAGRAAPSFSTALVVLSVLALILAATIALLAPLPYRDSVRQALQIDLLWTEALYKQISGFTLVTLGLIAILLSLRKRWRRLRVGDYASWRLVHVALGMTTVAVLIAHTGLHLGENLNRMLMMSFLTVALFGAASGGVTALEHRLGPASGARARRIATWLHIIACWPLPALLGFHIFTVYYF